jgi:RND family efflux transporter MFP subunit
MRKYLFLLIVPLLFQLAGCKPKATETVRQPLPVEVLVVDTVTNSMTRTYVGEVEENLSVSVSFPVGGRVERVYVHEGDHVREGQVLAVVNSTTAQNAYNSAKASLQQAEDAYNRLKKVYDQGSLAEVKWVEMQTTLEQARAMEQIARKQLDDCTLKAPMSGVVGSCNAKVGASMLPGEPAFTLLDMGRVAVVFSVPESEINTVTVGQETRVVVPALKDRIMTGRVTERSVTSSRVAHSYQVKVAFPNADKALMPGMVCKILLEEPENHGYVIPSKCVQTRPEGLSVWVVENGRAQQRVITSTEFVANGVLVTSGLHPGDTVITAGMNKLYVNAELKIDN